MSVIAFKRRIAKLEQAVEQCGIRYVGDPPSLAGLDAVALDSVFGGDGDVDLGNGFVIDRKRKIGLLAQEARHYGIEALDSVCGFVPEALMQDVYDALLDGCQYGGELDPKVLWARLGRLVDGKPAPGWRWDSGGKWLIKAEPKRAGLQMGNAMANMQDILATGQSHSGGEPSLGREPMTAGEVEAEARAASDARWEAEKQRVRDAQDADLSEVMIDQGSGRDWGNAAINRAYEAFPDRGQAEMVWLSFLENPDKDDAYGVMAAIRLSHADGKGNDRFAQRYHQLTNETIWGAIDRLSNAV